MKSNATRTQIFGLFVLAGQPLTGGQVVALARPLGLSATNVRSHLTRLVAEGALLREGPRRSALYRPGAERAQLVSGLAARLEEAPAAPWDGRWIVVAPRLPADRPGRRARLDRLWFDGFRPHSPACHIRPTWPAPWARERALAHAAVPGSLAFCGESLLPLDMAAVRRMYAVDTLDRHAHALADRLRRRIRTLRSGASALATRLELGGQVARLVAHDPRLPREILGDLAGLRELVAAYGQFEREAAARSREFLEEILRGA